MAMFFWDASALAKRYFYETGSETTDVIFDSISSLKMLSTPWGYTETYSILLRRRNSGVLDTASFTASVTALQEEAVEDEDFRLLSIDDSLVFNSVGMMHAHNLNATDAALLTLLLAYSRSSGVPVCVLIAADQRLIRAAQAEGLTTINPETMPVADVPSFLASLP